MKKRINAVRRVVRGSGIAGKGIGAGGCIEDAAGIVKERLHTCGRVLGAARVMEKGAEALGGVIVAGGVAKERLKTERGVVHPAGQAKES